MKRYNGLLEFHKKRAEEQKKIKEWSNTEEGQELLDKVNELHNKKTDIILPF